MTPVNAFAEWVALQKTEDLPGRAPATLPDETAPAEGDARHFVHGHALAKQEKTAGREPGMRDDCEEVTA